MVSWHGPRALDTIDDIEDERDLLSQDGESRKKLLKAVREFRGYKNFAAVSKRTKTSELWGSLPARRKDFNGDSLLPSKAAYILWCLGLFLRGICKKPLIEGFA